jgi:hypothetical protein
MAHKIFFKIKAQYKQKHFFSHQTFLGWSQNSLPMVAEVIFIFLSMFRRISSSKKFMYLSILYLDCKVVPGWQNKNLMQLKNNNNIDF